jgi:hypothetical protein
MVGKGTNLYHKKKLWTPAAKERKPEGLHPARSAYFSEFQALRI